MDPLVLEDVAATEWAAFQAGAELPARPDLVACWSRARALGAPLDGAEDRLVRGEALRLHAEHVELIDTLGQSILDRTTAQVAARDFLVLLADRDGVVVRTAGGGGFAATAARVRLIAGACWSEAARGTNAIGTALASNRPTEVHGHAHFGSRYHDLVCYAAPIRGVDGTTLGVLDATSRIAATDPEVAQIILRAARALEDLVRLEAYASAGVSVARVLGRSLDRIREPAFLVEADHATALPRVIRANPAARGVLGARAFVGVPWAVLVAEALAPSHEGLPVELGGRAWRLRVEPIAGPDGVVLAMLGILEPAHAAIAPRLARRELACDPFAPIFTEDPAVEAAIRWSRQLAASELPVMLLAETGAGKELFAAAIHAASPRARGPWHAINCGALAPALLEAELFGYAPGAFTGARPDGHAGLFRAAAGGTLFLDEVAEMPPAMQAALLRVVETGTFRRVGDTRLERTDVRLVCATCRDLPALVAAGTFRQDLYYRLKGATVRIPPLRERTDVIALASHLLADGPALSPEVADAIARHAWPGNVRELKSTLAVARVVAAGRAWLELADLPPELTSAPVAETALSHAERDALVRALVETSGNVSEAARRLGVARSTLHRMKRRHGL